MNPWQASRVAAYRQAEDLAAGAMHRSARALRVRTPVSTRVGMALVDTGLRLVARDGRLSPL